MKLISVGIAVVGLFLLLAMPPPHFDSLFAQPVLHYSVAEATVLTNALVHDVTKERWWMLLLGTTIVGYRLMRKHQALFESSYLYPGEYDFRRRALDVETDVDMELHTLPIKRTAEA